MLWPGCTVYEIYYWNRTSFIQLTDNLQYNNLWLKPLKRIFLSSNYFIARYQWYLQQIPPDLTDSFARNQELPI
jgi:hypothetical protein